MLPPPFVGVPLFARLNKIGQLPGQKIEDQLTRNTYAILKVERGRFSGRLKTL